PGLPDIVGAFHRMQVLRPGSLLDARHHGSIAGAQLSGGEEHLPPPGTGVGDQQHPLPAFPFVAVLVSLSLLVSVLVSAFVLGRAPSGPRYSRAVRQVVDLVPS